MRKKSETQSEKKPSEEPIPQQRRNLQSYEDYVNLIEETINGVFNKTVDSKTANSVGMLTGYGLQALREARGGKQKMSVFLQDMRRVNVEMLSQDEMDRFLQGDENVQIEVLQTLEGRGGIVEAEVIMTPKKEQKPKTDIKLLSQVAGIEVDKVKDALDGEGEKPPMVRKVHEWTRALGGNTRFCIECGLERSILQPEDMTAPCSGDWGTS
jgi:predicted RNA-binding protein YlxR (DUF448 family)